MDWKIGDLKKVCDEIDKGELRPSDLSNIYPLDSVTQKSECETVCKNIMMILERTGNQFRDLTIEEYVNERKKDCGYSEIELLFFEKVQKYTVSEATARLFSPAWDKAIIH
jgi:hypothetical protein